MGCGEGVEFLREDAKRGRRARRDGRVFTTEHGARRAETKPLTVAAVVRRRIPERQLRATRTGSNRDGGAGLAVVAVDGAEAVGVGEGGLDVGAFGEDIPERLSDGGDAEKG